MDYLAVDMLMDWEMASRSYLIDQIEYCIVDSDHHCHFIFGLRYRPRCCHYTFDICPFRNDEEVLQNSTKPSIPQGLCEMQFCLFLG